jgi:hypothetical protein
MAKCLVVLGSINRVANIETLVEEVGNKKAEEFCVNSFQLQFLHLSCSLCNADADVDIDDIYKPQGN